MVACHQQTNHPAGPVPILTVWPKIRTSLHPHPPSEVGVTPAQPPLAYALSLTNVITLQQFSSAEEAAATEEKETVQMVHHYPFTTHKNIPTSPHPHSTLDHSQKLDAPPDQAPDHPPLLKARVPRPSLATAAEVCGAFFSPSSLFFFFSPSFLSFFFVYITNFMGYMATMKIRTMCFGGRKFNPFRVAFFISRANACARCDVLSCCS